MTEITGGDDLQGLLVVSLEQAVAAPYVAGRLADAGARVIKVERPEGDFARKIAFGTFDFDHPCTRISQSASHVWCSHRLFK